MERIYFDKQIFSHLFKGENTIYQSFLKELYSNKEHFLYCYSHGHLLDLKNDRTDIKYKELEFMETLVGDNYLSYHAIEKRTSCYLVTPTQAFRDVEKDNDEPFSFASLFDDFDLSIATPEQRETIENAKHLLTTQKMDFGFSHVQNLPEEISNPLSKILPVGIAPMTFVEWTDHFISMLKSFEQDRTIYKDLRNVVDKHINNGKFTVEYAEIDFNDDLKNSVLQKSFIEYDNGNLNPNGDKEITDYDFFINAYFTLDLLGISKEPSKKVKFNNLMNDGYHSYYGAFCDYVVSDDDGFLKKTKALYRLLGIESKVYHITEFIDYFKLLSSSIEKDAATFFKLLASDLKIGLVLNSKPSLRFNRHTTTIKPFHQYLGYFNSLDCIKEDGQDYLLLTRKRRNYSYFGFYREYEGIINKAMKIFGVDTEFKGSYMWPNENQEIENNKWAGRFWDLGEVTVLIEINVGLKEICILITPKKATS